MKSGVLGILGILGIFRVMQSATALFQNALHQAYLHLNGNGNITVALLKENKSISFKIRNSKEMAGIVEAMSACVLLCPKIYATTIPRVRPKRHGNTYVSLYT